MKEQERSCLSTGTWAKGKVVDGEDKHHVLGGGALSWMAQAELGTMSSSYGKTCKKVQSKR